MRLVTAMVLFLLGTIVTPATVVAQQSPYEEMRSLPVVELVDFYEVVLSAIFVSIGMEEGLRKGAMVLSPENMRQRGRPGDWYSVLPLPKTFQQIADRWELPLEPRDDLHTIASITHPMPHKVDGVYNGIYFVRYVLAPPGRLRPIRGFSVSMFLERGPDGKWRQRPPP